VIFQCQPVLDTSESECRACRQGFTLIELIVVMVLISLTASFAVPKIRAGLDANELKTAVRRFIGLVAETGQEARSKRVALELRFDADEHLFTTVPVAPDTSVEEKNIYAKAQIGESVEVVDIASAHGDKITHSAGDLTIRFSSRGYVDKTIVHFRGDNGDELSVTLSPFLGVTRVLAGYVSLDDDRFTVTR
jgi:prepilin-type N-terminal cleavage/methylation domain-containing protein